MSETQSERAKVFLKNFNHGTGTQLETFQRNDLGPNATSELSQAHPGKRLNSHSLGSN